MFEKYVGNSVGNNKLFKIKKDLKFNLSPCYYISGADGT